MNPTASCGGGKVQGECRLHLPCPSSTRSSPPPSCTPPAPPQGTQSLPLFCSRCSTAEEQLQLPGNGSGAEASHPSESGSNEVPQHRVQRILEGIWRTAGRDGSGGYGQGKESCVVFDREDEWQTRSRRRRRGTVVHVGGEGGVTMGAILCRGLGPDGQRGEVGPEGLLYRLPLAGQGDLQQTLKSTRTSFHGMP